MAKRLKAQLQIKRARGVTKRVTERRPARRPTQPKPKAEVVPGIKGQVSAKARAGIFARQQREKRIRSIVGRAGRGRIDTPGRLKSFKGIRAGTIIERRPVNSTWLTEILLVMFNGQPALGCTFKDGVSIVYTTTSMKDFELMAAAGSKGKFIWRRLYHGVPGAGAPYRRI